MLTPSLEPKSYSATKMRWYSFNQGIKKAVQQKKPIIIDFYADWCHWCQQMDKDLFRNREIVRTLNKKYIAIRINTQKNTPITFKGKVYSPQEFSRALGVSGLPTIVFMDKNGQLVTKIPGYIQKDVFIPLLSYMQKECYKKKVSLKDYIENKVQCQ
jgi:thioredoxin-related protein